MDVKVNCAAVYKNYELLSGVLLPERVVCSVYVKMSTYYWDFMCNHRWMRGVASSLH